MGGITVFAALVSRLGDAEMAATNAVIQAWSVAFMLALSLGVGATTLVGQCVGAGESAQACFVTRRLLRIGYALMALPGVVYLAFPHRLMALFVKAEELDRLAPFARPLFIVVVVCLMFDLRFNVLAGALRGAGDTSYPMWVTIASAWLLFVPATLWATPRFGLVGAWACLILHLAVLATALGFRVAGVAWLRRPLMGATLPLRELSRMRRTSTKREPEGVASPFPAEGGP
jgi:Na+-driven multidrug efflux pump